jgi:drug/metabolite transporter (DMT)-like permease
MALGGHRIDPASFTTIRLASGALALAPIARVIGVRAPWGRGSWRAGWALFIYAAGFSLAYVSLGTGTGALILFGSVQVTMLAVALASGEEVRPAQWLGFAAAIAGLVYLVLPGLSAPDPAGALLMGVAGIAWGVYSIMGRGAAAPVAMTAGNFLRSAPLTLGVSALASSRMHLEPTGVVLALVSGVVTSGLGYVLWYTALPRLTTTQASMVQLVVPVLAALGGVALLGEHVTGRLVMASALILGGVAGAVLRRTAP